VKNCSYQTKGNLVSLLFHIEFKNPLFWRSDKLKKKMGKTIVISKPGQTRMMTITYNYITSLPCDVYIFLLPSCICYDAVYGFENPQPNKHSVEDKVVYLLLAENPDYRQTIGIPRHTNRVGVAVKY
jgi:hypothetical protein